MNYLQQKLICLCFISFAIFSCKKDPTVIGLSEAEKSWLPYQVGDTIRFKSNKGNNSEWVVSSKESVEDLKKSGFTGPGTLYCSFDITLNEVNTKDKLLVGYSFSSTYGPRYFAQIRFLYSNEKGSYNRINSDNIEDLNDLGELKTYLIKKPDFWFKFQKNKGLVSYKLDSIQTYEKY